MIPSTHFLFISDTWFCSPIFVYTSQLILTYLCLHVTANEPNTTTNTPVSEVRQGAVRRWGASSPAARHCSSLTLSLGKVDLKATTCLGWEATQGTVAPCPLPSPSTRRQVCGGPCTSNTCRHTYLDVAPVAPSAPLPAPPTHTTTG